LRERGLIDFPYSLSHSVQLIGLDYYLGPVQEFAVIGPSQSEEVSRALDLIRRPFRPNKVVAFQEQGKPAPASVPLLAGKRGRDTVTTYICRNYTCDTPLEGVSALKAALADNDASAG
jgi:uncharacterized protein